MIKLTVDQSLRAKLHDFDERLEICDESGNVLGYFSPVVDPSLYEGVDAPASDEELRQAEKEGGRPLKDILRDLNGSQLSRSGAPLPPDPVIEFYKKDIDRTLLRENLKLSVEERLAKLSELARFHEELQRAGRSARAGQ
jgi:hypothetical protein